MDLLLQSDSELKIFINDREKIIETGIKLILMHNQWFSFAKTQVS